MHEDLELLNIIRQAETEAAELIDEARRSAAERLKEARRDAHRLRERIIAEAREDAERSYSVTGQATQKALAALETEAAEAVEVLKRAAENRRSRVVERIVEAFWESLPPAPGPTSED